MHEWPLLIFTLLIQASVGLTLFTAVCASNHHYSIHIKCSALVVALVLGTAGVLASLIHLGYPLNAFNSLRHFASSWLSREITFAALYLVILGIATLLAIFTKRVASLLVVLAALVGMIDVYCMSKIYMSASVVTWMHINTWFMFFGTVFILGAVLAMRLIVQSSHYFAPQATARRLAKLTVKAVIITVVARLIVQPLYITFLAGVRSGDNVTFPLQPLAAFDALSGVRLTTWIMMAIGATLFGLSVRQPRIAYGYAMAGSVLLVIAEIMARYTFFSLS